MTDMWTRLSERTYLSREYVKKVVMTFTYSGSVDPWLDYIVRSEMEKILQLERADVAEW